MLLLKVIETRLKLLFSEKGILWICESMLGEVRLKKKIKDFSICCGLADFQAVGKITSAALGFHTGPSEPEWVLEHLSSAPGCKVPGKDSDWPSSGHVLTPLSVAVTPQMVQLRSRACSVARV